MASRLGGPFSASKFLFHIISVFREGEDLHISKLNLEDGILVVDGTIEALDYTDHEEERMNKGGIFRKVFR